MILALYPDIFGAAPAIMPAARHWLGVSAESRQLLGNHLAERLAAMPEGADISLTRLAAISMRLDLASAESSILGMLVLRRRGGPVAMFMQDLQQGIGLSAEAALGCQFSHPPPHHALAHIEDTRGLSHRRPSIRHQPYSLDLELTAELPSRHIHSPVPWSRSCLRVYETGSRPIMMVFSSVTSAARPVMIANALCKNRQKWASPTT